MAKTALLISTYNWPSALNLVFKSLQVQKEMPDEVIIADDGSTEETRDLINSYRERISIPVRHIWHQDNGFRKSTVLNKALVATDADYVVQIDGDCIMHEDFLRDHKALREENVFLFGSRVNIVEEAVADVLREEKFRFHFFSPHISKRTRSLNIPFLRNLYSKSSRFSSKLRGCNLSYWRSDFLEVNGYNEDMEGWGREDSEFVLRLLNKGVQGRRLRYGGIIFHIYHSQNSRQFLQRNSEVQKRTIEENKIRCQNGVDKYLSEKEEKDLRG